MSHRDHMAAGISRMGQGHHPDLVLRRTSQPPAQTWGIGVLPQWISQSFLSQID
jgi:hypothetical protein